MKNQLHYRKQADLLLVQLREVVANHVIERITIKAKHFACDAIDAHQTPDTYSHHINVQGLSSESRKLVAEYVNAVMWIEYLNEMNNLNLTA